MNQANTVQPDSTIFDRNVSVLKTVEPELAKAVLLKSDEDFKKTQPPKPIQTRDGKINFHIPRQDGRFEWLGRTSIPSVRAEAVIEKFDTGQGNVLVPRIGEGTELLLLTRRLQRHRAVFAWEEDLGTIQLVLHLHDYSDALTEGRLVLLNCPLNQLTETLFDWLEQHPGHLCPSRIMLWPWQIPQDLSNCQAAVEKTYSRFEKSRARNLQAIQEQLNQLPTASSAINTAPLLAIYSMRAEPDMWDFSTRLAEDSQEYGYQPISMKVRTPDDVHPLARAQKLTDGGRRPDLALLLDITRQELGAILPTSVPAISWIGPNAPDKVFQSNGQKSQDPIALTSDWLKKQARSAGLPENQVFVCPPPCLKGMDPDDEQLTVDRPTEIALFGDLYSIEPQVYGYKLATQIEIWKCMVDLLWARIEQFDGADMAEILARAEQKKGVRLEDSALRQAMSDTMQTWVAPTLLRQFIAQIFTKKGFTINIFGRGWPGQEGMQVHQPLVTLDQKLTVLRRCQLFIHADLTGAATSDALLAAGNGAVLLARKHPCDSKTGGLPTLLEPGREMFCFALGRELTEIADELLNNSSKREQTARQACRRCLQDHRLATRLEQLKMAISSYSGVS